MKILICDDEVFTLKAMSYELKKSGYEIVTAADGFDAMNKIVSERPDIIISDIAMPYLSGLELLNYLKSTFNDNRAILLVSALVREELIKTAMRLGADAFITKPFRKGELTAKVKEIIERKKKSLYPEEAEKKRSPRKKVSKA